MNEEGAKSTGSCLGSSAGVTGREHAQAKLLEEHINGIFSDKNRKTTALLWERESCRNIQNRGAVIGSETCGDDKKHTASVATCNNTLEEGYSLKAKREREKLRNRNQLGLGDPTSLNCTRNLSLKYLEIPEFSSLLLMKKHRREQIVKDLKSRVKPHYKTSEDRLAEREIQLKTTRSKGITYRTVKKQQRKQDLLHLEKSFHLPSIGINNTEVPHSYKRVPIYWETHRAKTDTPPCPTRKTLKSKTPLTLKPTEITVSPLPQSSPHSRISKFTEFYNSFSSNRPMETPYVKDHPKSSKRIPLAITSKKPILRLAKQLKKPKVYQVSSLRTSGFSSSLR